MRKRADVDDPARPLLAHDRKDRARHVHYAIEIGRHQFFDLDGAQLLEIAEQAVAGIVDENIDASERFDRRVDCRLRLYLIGDVQLDKRKIVAREIAQRTAQLVEIAAGCDDTVTRLQCRPGRCSADAAARTRDEPDLAHV
jgi:hypothetical protein